MTDLLSFAKYMNHDSNAVIPAAHYSKWPSQVLCYFVPRILEAARCSHVTDAGFTVLARVSLILLSVSCVLTCIPLVRTTIHSTSLCLNWIKSPSHKTICLSSQNCHELEKMDLEECILVREFVVSVFPPKTILWCLFMMDLELYLGFYLFVWEEVGL